MTHDSPAPAHDILFNERGIRFDNQVESIAATQMAVKLALPSAIAWSMTRCQMDVFRQLCRLQMEDAGPHSLLPNVIANFVTLACSPWWDREMSCLPDESDGRTLD